MRLTELGPKFYKKDTFDPEHPDDWNRGTSKQVDTPAEADHILFLCPFCFNKNGGAVGTHSIVLEKPHVPVTIPGDGRWSFVGYSAEDLTLKGVTSDSVLIPQGCKAHFFVVGGEIRMA